LAPNHTLLLRFALVNIVALGLLGAAWMQGWLDGFAERRTWIISLAIFAVFVWGLILTGFRLFRMNQAIVSLATDAGGHATPFADTFTRLKTNKPDERALQTNMARMELGNQIGAIRYIANSLVFLGLIGTVIGFIIGLSGIDAAATKDVDKIAPMITELINGMSVALYTTLLGALLNIWLNVNLRILTDGSVRLLALLVDKSAPGAGTVPAGAALASAAE
jgi:biopolymer transport protein ExbB/TolQ